MKVLVTRAQTTPVTHMTGPRVTHTTRMVKLTLSDGTTVLCEHTHGHISEASIRNCATKLVAKINAAQ